MDYNNGGLFGYDQILVNPSCETYKDYDRKSIIKNKYNGRQEGFTNRLNNYKHDYYKDYDRLDNHSGQHVRGRAVRGIDHFTSPNCNSVQDYLNQTAIKETELNNLKKKLCGYKQRHDMMFMFITCLFIIIIIQYSLHMNTISSLQRHMHPIYIAHQSPAPDIKANH